MLQVHFLARPLRPVGHQWQLHGAGVRLQFSMHGRQVALADFTAAEHGRQPFLHCQAARKHHQSAGRLVQAVHQQDRRVVGLQACEQTVLFVRSTARHGQHAGGFVGKQQVVVLLDCERRQGVRCWRQGIGGWRPFLKIRLISAGYPLYFKPIKLIGTVLFAKADVFRGVFSESLTVCSCLSPN